MQKKFLLAGLGFCNVNYKIIIRKQILQQLNFSKSGTMNMNNNVKDKDYKINLPKTNFAMKANLPEREPKFLALWQELQLDKQIAQTNSTTRKQKFILHDGPPYANGDIHIGHAYNKVLKDILNKVKLFQGYAIPYVPGWDCHGLPIELNLEKKIGKVGDKVNVDEFLQACRSYATSQVKSQLNDFVRLGVIGDWENPYQTMNYNYEADIVRSLQQIIANGYLVRGYKPVHWCCACGSALAEAEVEYQDKTSPAIDMRFDFVNSEQLTKNFAEQFSQLNNQTISVPVWTTTPWTLPANEAVALNPQETYVLVATISNELNNPNLLIVQDLLSTTLERYGITQYNVIKTYLGSEFAGMLLQHPFLDKQVPIILGDHVTTDAGTGAVHTAPAHGMEDYIVGQKYNLPVNNPVDVHGKFIATTPHFAGKNVFQANEDVIALMQEKNTLLHHESIQHSYPHCWRHKTPLIFRATPQWFISLEQEGKYGKLRDLALKTIENISWLSPRGKERMFTMVKNRPEWCVSRQRVWGSPMPLFINKHNDELHPQTLELLTKIAEGIEQEGIAYWQKLDLSTFLQQYSDTNKYPVEDYIKAKDTLDVWFDSGVSHFCVLQQRQELDFPADIYVEGSDQYRGWFQSSLLTSLALTGTTPYKQVLSHGFTVDGKGRKMSKSLGNVISPQKIIKSHGADILRLWVATSNPDNEIAIADEILQGCVDIYRSWRNTLRYMLGNLNDFDPTQDMLDLNSLQGEPLAELNLHVLTKFMHEIKTTVTAYNTEYKFYHACANLQNITKNLLSNYYFDIIKDTLYTHAKNSKIRRHTQTTMYHILEILVRQLAPFISFTAEETWQEMKNMFANAQQEKSVFLASSYEIKAEYGLINSETWQLVDKIRGYVNLELEKLRADKSIGSNLNANVTLYCDVETYNILEQFTKLNAIKVMESELRYIFITSNVKLECLSNNSELTTEITHAVKYNLAENNDIFIKTDASQHTKCPRCWHQRPNAEFGINEQYPELCQRCVEAILC